MQTTLPMPADKTMPPLSLHFFTNLHFYNTGNLPIFIADKTQILNQQYHDCIRHQSQTPKS
jgi:hypothetical protein